MKNVKVVTIYLGLKAGKGLNPDNVPTAANVARLTITIATIYSNNREKTPNINKSWESARNLNFMLLLPFCLYYNINYLRRH